MDPAEMPDAGDAARLGQAVGSKHWSYEVMVNFVAYTGLRWGELIALTAGQINQAQRVVIVDGKVVEVRGHLFVEAPKNRKRRRTIYPRATPAGWPLAEKVAARIAEVAMEQASGRNPLGLMFPTPGAGVGAAMKLFAAVVIELLPGRGVAHVGWRSRGSRL